MKRIILLILLSIGSLYPQALPKRGVMQYLFVDTLSSATPGLLYVNDSLWVHRQFRGDSILIPVRPPYGTGQIIFRGMAGVFYQMPNGTVFRLDSVQIPDSVRAAFIADTTRRAAFAYRADSSRSSFRADSALKAT